MSSTITYILQDVYHQNPREYLDQSNILDLRKQIAGFAFIISWQKRKARRYSFGGRYTFHQNLSQSDPSQQHPS